MFKKTWQSDHFQIDPPGMDLSRRFIFRETENAHLYGPYESVTARLGAVRDRSIRKSVLDEGAVLFYLFIVPLTLEQKLFFLLVVD